VTTEVLFRVGSYSLAADRYYDQETHLWVALVSESRARCGFDPLGAETCGDIVAVSFEAAGTVVARGDSFGNLEAAKFVGPLIAPVSGRLVSVNEAVIRNPSLLNDSPMYHWLAEFEVDRSSGELRQLLRGQEAVTRWFGSEIERYRSDGMIAE